MPGFILHLTAGAMLIDETDNNPMFYYEDDINNFFTGCILPDVSERKWMSHFRNKEQKGKIMQVPDLSLFMDMYGDRINEPLFLGYLFHLYIDYRFFNEYIPRVASFIDENGNETPYIKDASHVHIKKLNKIITDEQYRSDEYYYGDYTRMNTYLINRYNIPVDIFDNIKIPEIYGVDVDDFTAFVEKMKGYLSVSENEIENLKIFDIEDVLDMIKEWTYDFMNEYNID